MKVLRNSLWVPKLLFRQDIKCYLLSTLATEYKFFKMANVSQNTPQAHTHTQPSAQTLPKQTSNRTINRERELLCEKSHKFEKRKRLKLTYYWLYGVQCDMFCEELRIYVVSYTFFCRFIRIGNWSKLNLSLSKFYSLIKSFLHFPCCCFFYFCRTKLLCTHTRHKSIYRSEEHFIHIGVRISFFLVQSAFVINKYTRTDITTTIEKWLCHLVPFDFNGETETWKTKNELSKCFKML